MEWAFMEEPVCSFVCFLVANITGSQTLSVVWPEDVLDGSCEESIDLFQEQPQVEEGSSCSDVQATFLDEMLEANCEQETWVDRHWQVVGCDDTLMHVQRIRLVDQSPPRVVSARSVHRTLLLTDAGMAPKCSGQL